MVQILFWENVSHPRVRNSLFRPETVLASIPRRAAISLFVASSYFANASHTLYCSSPNSDWRETYARRLVSSAMWIIFGICCSLTSCDEVGLSLKSGRSDVIPFRLIISSRSKFLRQVVTAMANGILLILSTLLRIFLHVRPLYTTLRSVLRLGR